MIDSQWEEYTKELKGLIGNLYIRLNKNYKILDILFDDGNAQTIVTFYDGKEGTNTKAYDLDHFRIIAECYHLSDTTNGKHYLVDPMYTNYTS